MTLTYKFRPLGQRLCCIQITLGAFKKKIPGSRSAKYQSNWHEWVGASVVFKDPQAIPMYSEVWELLV